VFTLRSVCLFVTTKKYGTKAMKSKSGKGNGNGVNEIPNKTPARI
jgi:hypothetical protein